MNKKINKGVVSTDYALVLSMVFAIFIVLILIISSLQKIYISKNDNIMPYYSQINLSYNVCLKDNEFFDDKCLNNDREYISTIINNININFNYIFSAANRFDYKYSYEIVTELVANEKIKTRKKIYEKIDSLVEKKTIENKDSSNFIINETININYDKYNDVMKELKKEYAILFDSKLIVKLNIITEGKKSNINNSLKLNEIIMFEIPLQEQTISLNSNYNNLKKDYILDDNDVILIEKDNLRKFIMVAFALEGLLIFGVYYIIRRRLYKKNRYKLEVAKIMKEYDRYITIVDIIPSLADKTVINVSSFKELLDSREWLNKPIIYAEQKEKGCFVIINDNDAYIFMMDK